MLKKLSITNYALIDELELEFDSGLSIITGETGAGKSILLGALGLLIGQRVDTQVLQDKSRKCIVEGSFDVSSYHAQTFFQENELDYDDLTVIRREINTAGKSRAFINDTPVNLAQLKELALRLVDIHSQHQTLSINTSAFQLSVLDAYAKNDQLRTNYFNQFQHWNKLNEELDSLKEQERKSKLDLDYFQFQLDELNTISLIEHEENELEQELNTLEHAEEIAQTINAAVNVLSNGEHTVIGALADVSGQLLKIAPHNNVIAELQKRIESCRIELEDATAELAQSESDISFDDERISWVNERLNSLNGLFQKHRVQSTAELIKIQQDLAQKLSGINSLDERIFALDAEKSGVEKALLELGGQLSIKRKKATSLLEKEVGATLKFLGMPNAQFTVSLERTKEFMRTGLDKIQFLFTANKGVSPLPINKVASGGELSRLMLSVKSHAAKHASLPTVIFDEIDTGVSGEIADSVGEVMRAMACNMQVISITHLPQIAGKGNTHFLVSKEVIDNSTRSVICSLTEKQRVNEIAKMLSGKELTDAAVKNARELLKV